MKHTLLTLAAVLMLAMASRSQAQNPLIHHSIKRLINQPPSAGRDFWFSFMSNEWGVDEGGKYMAIYITSPINTTAHIESRGRNVSIPIEAYQVGTYLCPEMWEMESSGEVESKGIHVWSNDADLTVYTMSHNQASTDGSYIIPTAGWGTDYVVAANASYFDGDQKYRYDFPSTLAITVDEDNTVVSITPSCDCRQCYTGNDTGDVNSSIVVYPQGVPSMFTINRGQDLELMPVKAEGPDGYDLSGTIVHANQPVGVSGGSVEANIPADFIYADRVEDMMPPVRSWGETYYSTNFQQPSGTPADHDLARYLFISSVPNQTVYRHGCTTGDHTECEIYNQYGTSWDELAGAQKFFSNDPFLVVEYMNSSTYPDSTAGAGNPCEAHLAARQQYAKTVTFETPVSTGSQFPDPYYNYANITVDIHDVNKTLYDGTKISSHPGQCIDGEWEIITLTDVSPGAHLITGDDSGVGVFVYGYGNDESYAWPAASHLGTFHSFDTIPPIVDTEGQCYAANIEVSDSTYLVNGVDIQSGLSQINVDSDYNMTYVGDPNFIPGSGQEISGTFYSMYVKDITREAMLRVDIYDVAGNETIITSVYKPSFDSIEPPIQNLGAFIGGGPHIAYDTIFNNSESPITISQLQLKYGNVGFSIFDSVGGPLDLSPLQPGQHRLIQIQFVAIQQTRAVDSIIFGAPCDPQSVAVIGSGGANDFTVTSQSWLNEAYPPPADGYIKTVYIDNLSNNSITIDSAWWTDKVHFRAVDMFPIAIPREGGVPFRIAYFPDNGSLTVPNRTQGNWTSPQVLNNGVVAIRNDSLIGNAVAPSTTFGDDTTITLDCAPPGDTISIQLTIAASGNGPSTIYRVTQSDSMDFMPLQGTIDNNNISWNPSTDTVSIPGGQTAAITLRYPVPASQNTSVVDYITAVSDAAGDQIGGRPVKVTITTHYTAFQTLPTSVTFPPALFQGSPLSETFLIQNTSTATLDLSGIFLALGRYNAAFTVTANPPLPDSLQPGQPDSVTVTFDPSTSDDPVQTAIVYISSPDACNWAEEAITASISNSGVAEKQVPQLNAAVIASEDGRSLEIILPANPAAPANFELVNVLGQSVLGATFGTQTEMLDASSLPRGVYFYRITLNGTSQMGKVILGQ